MLKRNQKALAILLAFVFLLACVPSLAPAIPPTLDPFSLNTVIAQTAGAAATQTAALLSPTPTLTETPSPTMVPSETPTSTPTFIFILATNTVATPTNTPGAAYDCAILAQSPANNVGFAPGTDFDARWLVQNRGTVTWDANNVDYRYASGDKFHKASIYDMPKSVPAGEQVDIIVDMKAPGEAGTYTTTWEIRSGKTTFCSMSVTIIVN